MCACVQCDRSELCVLVFNVTIVNFDLSLTVSCKAQISSSQLADCK